MRAGCIAAALLLAAVASGCGPKDNPLPPGPSSAIVSTGQWTPAVDRETAPYKISPAIVLGIIEVESGGNPRAVSPTGAKGLMQLTPATAKRYGLGDAFDPNANIAAGVRLVHDLLVRFHGDVRLALAAYNTGPKTVENAGGVPKSAAAYVNHVLEAAAHYGK